MLLKGSLSESDWLSEAHPLSEEASLLSERKTLENVKSENRALSASPVRPAKLLSLLALSASKPAKRPITNSRSVRHALWVRIHNLRSPKIFKTGRGEGNQAGNSLGKKEQSIKAERRHFSSHFYFTIPFPYYFILVLSPPC